MAAIASRTPEGVPNHCPVCGGLIRVEPSQPPGDAPCPNCGVLLWFFPIAEGVRLYETEAVALIRERIYRVLCSVLPVERDDISDFEPVRVLGDSLDLVELMMELEEELGLTLGFTIPKGASAAGINTIAELIDYILRHQQL